MINQEVIIVEICDQFDAYIKEKVVKDLSDAYMQLHREIDKRSLVKKNSIELPRLSHFLQSLFFHIFEKLHKGDRVVADKLISDLKIQVNLLNQKNDFEVEPDYIVDDTAYAQQEFLAIMNKYEAELKNDIKAALLDYYNKAIIEISQKNLAFRSGYSEPKLERFIKYVFSFVFAKLHRGDKQKASELLYEELAKFDASINS